MPKQKKKDKYFLHLNITPSLAKKLKANARAREQALSVYVRTLLVSAAS